MDNSFEVTSVTCKKKISILNRELFEFIRQNKFLASSSSLSCRNSIFCYIKEKCIGLKWNDVSIKLLKSKIWNFTLALSRKWSKSCRYIKRFITLNSEWLDTKFEFPPQDTLSTSTGGRPPKQYTECAERAKRLKIKTLMDNNCITSPEFIHAAKSKMQKSGQRSVVKLFNEASSSSNRAKEMMQIINMPETSRPIPFTADEALAFFVQNGLSKQQYLNIRLSAKERNADIYPAYDKIIEAKKQCYPDNCNISETCCEIKLQDLLNHTSKRIFKIHNINTIESHFERFEIIYKWGCDGSNGQSMYKQMYSSPTLTLDSDLFLFSIVPLQLFCFNEKNEKLIIWQNNRTSSTRYCRPIKFEFKKETVETTLHEVKAIEDQIKKLTSSIIIVDNREITVAHTLLFTMVDGKVCNSMTHTSSQTCYICRATPKQMNNIHQVKKNVIQQDHLKFGLSSLHAWIRCFECLLHVSYRLEIKTWAVKSLAHKLKFAERKKMIQNKFRTEMGLLVDVVLQGKGNTNDGNTARRFFSNPEKSSNITGIKIELLQRFSNILSTIASGFEVNPEAFDAYALDTATLFVNLYPWYYMPSSVHKILIHGADIIRFGILPIGQLSEEAQESRNKDYKHIREHHTRKNSRLNTNEDLLHMLLVSSDPYISSIRPLPDKYIGDFSDDVKSLLVLPENSKNKNLNQSFSDMDLSS